MNRRRARRKAEVRVEKKSADVPGIPAEIQRGSVVARRRAHQRAGTLDARVEAERARLFRAFLEPAVALLVRPADVDVGAAEQPGLFRGNRVVDQRARVRRRDAVEPRDTQEKLPPRGGLLEISLVMRIDDDAVRLRAGNADERDFAVDGRAVDFQRAALACRRLRRGFRRERRKFGRVVRDAQRHASAKHDVGNLFRVSRVFRVEILRERERRAPERVGGNALRNEAVDQPAARQFPPQRGKDLFRKLRPGNGFGARHRQRDEIFRGNAARAHVVRGDVERLGIIRVGDDDDALVFRRERRFRFGGGFRGESGRSRRKDSGEKKKEQETHFHFFRIIFSKADKPRERRRPRPRRARRAFRSSSPSRRRGTRERRAPRRAFPASRERISRFSAVRR